MKTTRQKLLISVAVAAVLAFVGHVAYGPMYAAGRHLIHGRTVRCGDVTVTVPSSWWATTDLGGTPACMLLTESSWFHGDPQAASIAFFSEPQTPDPNDALSRANTIATFTDKGTAVASVRTGDIAGTPTACYETRDKKAPPHSQPNEILCNLHNRFVVHYHSDGLDRTNDFYKIMSGLK
jgi:hypothetical protein